MRLDNIYTIDEMRVIAKHRLPRIVFDFIDGGAGDEQGLGNNADQFRNFRLVPRYLVDVSQRSQKTTIFISRRKKGTLNIQITQVSTW